MRLRARHDRCAHPGRGAVDDTVQSECVTTKSDAVSGWGVVRTPGQGEPGYMRIVLNLVPAAVVRRREGVSRRRVFVAVAVLPIVGIGGLYAVLSSTRAGSRGLADYDARLTRCVP